MAAPTRSFEEIDGYIEDLFTKPDDALAQAVKDSEAAGLPKINVSANEGRLLFLLAKIAGAKRILEIGTLGGYSGIWLARALGDGGKMISLELDQKHADVAARNLKRAGVGDKVEIRVGPALDSLKKMEIQNEAPFDVVFIDADKGNYPAYLEICLKLVKSGSVIIGDNCLRNGKVLDAAGDTDLMAIKKFNERMATHPLLEGILLPIIRGSIDGVAISRVK